MGDYEGLRDALHPALRRAKGSVIDEELDEQLVAAVESFGSALRSVGQYAQKVAPGALQGAITGFQVGGPWGALIGAGAGAALGSGGSAAAAPVAAALPIAPTAAAPNPAALQLLGMLARPEVVQALQALALGPAGAPTVQIGNIPVPVAAIANTINSLSEMAAAQHHLSNPGVGRYGRRWSRHVESMFGEAGAAPAARASAVLGLLADSDWDDDIDEQDDPADLRDLIDLYRLGGD